MGQAPTTTMATNTTSTTTLAGAKCSSFTCPTGKLLISNAAIVVGETEGVCCVDSCSTWNQCTTHKILKTDAATIAGSSLDVCCDDLCSGYTCPQGTSPISAASSTKGKSLHTCCIPSCNFLSTAISCPPQHPIVAEILQISQAPNLQMWQSYAGNQFSEEQIKNVHAECCKDACAEKDCTANYLLKSNAATLEGGNRDRCCDASCSLHNCPTGQTQKDGASTIRGSSDASCCAQACSGFSCDPNKGLMLKLNAEQIAGASEGECCDGEFDCSPYTNRSGTTLRKVVLMEETSKQTCANQNNGVGLGQDKMQQYCQEFCSTDGILRGLPLQLGSPQFGFNLTSMNSVCGSVTNVDHSLREECKSGSNALLEIQVKAADFVAKVKVFKAEQMAFRGSMQAASKALEDDLIASQSQLAASAFKLRLLKKKFTDWSDGVTDGQDFSKLQRAMDNLKTSANLLNDAVQKNLDLFEQFVARCNVMLLGVGSRNEYLLDICPQSSSACIEREIAGHVGCCCGLNPIVTPSMLIDGFDATMVQTAQGQVAAARRLAETAEINVCAKASKDSSTEVGAARDRLKALGQEALFQGVDQELQTKYSSYFAECGGGRRLEDLERDESPQVDGRLLQNNQLQCQPPTSNGLKVAFSETLETDLCHLQTPKVTNDAMRSQCNKFCAPNAVPLLLGTEAYGFQHSEVNSICLADDAVLKHDSTLLGKCGEWSQGFQDIELKAVDFIEQLEAGSQDKRDLET